MDKFYKIVLENGKVSIGGGESTPIGAVEITENEFNEMLNKKEDYNSKIRSYREQVNIGRISLIEVPEEYIDEVKSVVNQERVITNEYGVQDDTYAQIVDDYTLSLIESGVL